MRKSGLHKQIASIFDGVPAAASGLTAGSSALAAATGQTASAAVPLKTARPMPMPRSRTKVSAARNQTPSLAGQLSKTVFGKSGLDPRQKKMTLIVGMLALVFGAVLIVSLGGVGKSLPSAKKDKNAVQADAKNAKPIAWAVPGPLPEQMRDPMQVGEIKQAQATAEQPTASMVVKGIVFSQDKPSALINNEILGVGQTCAGATIIRIGRGEVEFEANGKRWTQPVQ